ncbi:MAG: restriction endonuclease [Thermodesulfobacteriota bacterium]
MASRRQSPFEDFIEVTSKLPWKAGVGLAIVSYMVLHMMAGMHVQQPTTASNMGAYAGKQFYVTLAMFGQIIIPFALLLGSLVSFTRQRKCQKLYKSVEQHTPATTAKHSAMLAVERMTWQEFEMLVGESFRQQGYKVKETGGGGADGGIDLQMTLNGKKYLVQCKQWKTCKVSVKTVREFFGVMVDAGAVGGFIVTSGVFTNEAISFAADKQINLVDGGKLLKIINGASPAAAPPEMDIPPAPPPLCPKCNSIMVKRTARKGSNAGKEFWGCSQFPKCRQVVNLL